MGRLYDQAHGIGSFAPPAAPDEPVAVQTETPRRVMDQKRRSQVGQRRHEQYGGKPYAGTDWRPAERGYGFTRERNGITEWRMFL